MLDTDLDLSHPMLGRLRDYWAAKCADGMLPGRQHIDPVDIPELLPMLYLVDIVPGDGDGALRFRFRLLGDTITSKFMRNSTSKWLDEIYDREFYERLRAGYLDIMRTKIPGYAALNMPVAGREFIRYQRLVCPLAADGTTVDGFVGVIAFPD